MRSGFLVIALAACASPATARPTWPKQTAHETDGGESLAPRAAARAIAATEDDDARPSAPAAPERPATAAGPSIERVAPAAAAVAPDEPVQTEDIVIEIDD